MIGFCTFAINEGERVLSNRSCRPDCRAVGRNTSVAPVWDDSAQSREDPCAVGLGKHAEPMSSRGDSITERGASRTNSLEKARRLSPQSGRVPLGQLPNSSRGAVDPADGDCTFRSYGMITRRERF